MTENTKEVTGGGNAPRVIVKHYDYLRQAESYQNRLYNRFDYVRLVDWPRFTNHGNYTWEVK